MAFHSFVQTSGSQEGAFGKNVPGAGGTAAGAAFIFATTYVVAKIAAVAAAAPAAAPAAVPAAPGTFFPNAPSWEPLV